MTVTYGNLLRLADLATGTEVGTWGDLTDTNICTLLAQAVTGVSYITVAANNTSDQIITALNGTPDQARSAILNFNGTLTVTKPMIVPNSVKLYHVFNSTSGGGAIVIKPAAATNSVSIPSGQADIVFCDGVNAYSLLTPKLGTYLPLTGGYLSGGLVVQNGGMLLQATHGGGTSQLFIQSFYGNNAVLYWGNSRGARWLAYSTNTPENGGNGGSDFVLASMNDSGVYLGNAISITRYNNAATFYGPVSFNGSVSVAGAISLGSNVNCADLHAVNVYSSNVVSGSYLKSYGSMNVDANFGVGGSAQVNGNFVVLGNVNANAHFGLNGLFVSSVTTGQGMFDGPGARYHQYQSGWFWQWDASNGVLVWFKYNSVFFVCRATDNLVYNQLGPVGGYGGYQNYSDGRAKTAITPSAKGLAEVLRLKPVEFNRISRDTSKTDPAAEPREVGFIAQDVLQVIPEAVREAGIPLPDGTGGEGSSDPSLVMTYDTITAVMVNAVKELAGRVKALEARAGA